MPWLKTSDQAGTHPRVLGVAGLPGADARTVNEVFGFVSRLATLAASDGLQRLSSAMICKGRPSTPPACCWLVN